MLSIPCPTADVRKLWARQENAMTTLSKLPEYQSLREHQQSLAGTHLRDLFAQDPERGKSFALEAVGIYLDYSKNLVTKQTLELLVGLAQATGVGARIQAMFR